MTHAMVFDAVRTPRGKGKRDGSLHAVKPVDLLGGLLNQLQARHDFDTAEVDDVVMGCVSPVGEQGSVLPKVAALKAGWDFRCAGVQVNRFCASGLEATNMAAAQVMSGQSQAAIGGGVYLFFAGKPKPAAAATMPVLDVGPGGAAIRGVF